MLDGVVHRDHGLSVSQGGWMKSMTGMLLAGVLSEVFGRDAGLSN